MQLKAKWLTFVSFAAIALDLSSCVLRKTEKSSGAPGDGSPRTASYVSCRKDLDGATQRCLQYDSANSNPILMDSLKSGCGLLDKRLEGFVYMASACPTENRLGDCVANKPTSVYSDYYYGPAFTVESAGKACQSTDGTWTSP